jgi:hypothetical protein
MKRRGPTGSLERNRRDAAAEKERVEQKDQKIGTYEEDASEQVIGALIECIRRWDRACSSRRTRRACVTSYRPSAPLAAAPSTFLIFPIFLSPFLSPAAEACCALHPVLVDADCREAKLYQRSRHVSDLERGRDPRRGSLRNRICRPCVPAARAAVD